MSSAITTPVTQLPTTGYLRKAQLLGTIVPVSESTFWRWVRSGRFPAAVKLSPGVTAWRAEDVRAWLDKQSSAMAA